MRSLLVVVVLAGCGRKAEPPPPHSEADCDRPRRVVTLTSRTEWTQFGGIFAADRDRIAVSDHIDRGDQFAVRMFRVSGDRVIEETTIKPPSPDVRFFGEGLAFDNTILAVTGDDAVYLYARSGTTWKRGETVQLTGALACGEERPRYLALRREALVVATTDDRLCIYEWRRGRPVVTAAFEGVRDSSSYPPFAFDGDRLLLPRIDEEIIEVYRRSGDGWSRSANIDRPPTSDAMFPEGAAIDGTIAAGGTATAVTMFDVSTTPPRAIATLLPQSDNEVPVFGRHMALSGNGLAVYDRDGTHLYAVRDGAWGPAGMIEQVRKGRQVSFLDHVALADLLWIGETDSNAGEKLPGGGKIYGYRWE